MHSALQTHKLKGNVAIILRHAERHPIINYTDAFDLCLTEKGKTEAYEFGQLFKKFDSVKLYHSPVLRCRQTAEGIVAGILSINKKASIVGYLLDLGGPYVTSPWEGITAMVERMGQSAFVRKWFNNEFAPDYIMPLNLAAKSQLQILIKQLHPDNSSTINVTHDWNIMLLREYYFNLRHEDIGEPDYLDGLYAYIQNESLHLVYNEHKKIIDLTSIG
jgi:hypothetical protein